MNPSDQQALSLRFKCLELLLALTIFSTVFLSFLSYGNLINKLITGVFAVAAGFTLLGSRKKWMGPEAVLLSAWTFYALLISFFAPDPSLALSKSATMFQVLVFYVCVVNVLVITQETRGFLWVFVVSFLTGALASMTVLKGFQIGGSELGHVGTRMVGTFGNANTMGIAANHALLALVFLLAGSRHRLEKLLIFILAGAVILVAAGTGSRTAAIGLVLIMGAALWMFDAYNPFKNPRAFALSAALLLTACILLFVLVRTNSHIQGRWLNLANVVSSGDLNQSGSENSMIHRAALIQKASDLFWHHPFGIGLDNFRTFMGTYSHSNVFELLSCTGLLGFCLFYAIYGILLFKALSRTAEAFGGIAFKRFFISVPCIFFILDLASINYYRKNFWLVMAFFTGALVLGGKKTAVPPTAPARWRTA